MITTHYLVSSQVQFYNQVSLQWPQGKLDIWYQHVGVKCHWPVPTLWIFSEGGYVKHSTTWIASGSITKKTSKQSEIKIHAPIGGWAVLASHLPEYSRVLQSSQMMKWDKDGRNQQHPVLCAYRYRWQAPCAHRESLSRLPYCKTIK